MTTSQDNAAIVADMVREFDFPQYAAALFASIEKRRAMLALSAFELEIQRIPDQVSQPLPGEVRLQWWTDAIEGLEHGGVAGHPVAAELLDAITQNGIAREPLLALIDARKFDLYDDPMPTPAALQIYHDDVCGSLVGIKASLLDKAYVTPDELVRDGGRALGLTRTIARLPHDAAHSRCFLPANLMVAHGITRHQILAGEDSDALRALRDDLIVRARQDAASVRASINRIPRISRPAFLPIVTVQRELDALQRAEPFAVVSPLSRLRVLSSQWWAMRM